MSIVAFGVFVSDNGIRISRQGCYFFFLEDERTNNWVPIGLGMLEKHMFMNIGLKSIMIYIAKICNKDKDDKFAYNIIKYQKLKNSSFDFL